MPRTAKGFASLALAAILSVGAIAAPLTSAAASANPAQARGMYFSAELAEPTDETTPIAGGQVFRCEGTTCIGPRSGDRPLRVCRDLQREVGTIASFTVDGEAMSESALANCNR